MTAVLADQWAKPALDAAVPDLAEFEEFHGCRVSAIGEDSNLIILGHTGKLRAIAAFNAYSRRIVGLKNLDDGYVRTADDAGVVDEVHHKWATEVFDVDFSGEWFLAVHDGPVQHAFPVTVYQPEI